MPAPVPVCGECVMLWPQEDSCPREMTMHPSTLCHKTCLSHSVYQRCTSTLTLDSDQVVFFYTLTHFSPIFPSELSHHTFYLPRILITPSWVGQGCFWRTCFVSRDKERCSWGTRGIEKHSWAIGRGITGKHTQQKWERMTGISLKVPWNSHKTQTSQTPPKTFSSWPQLRNHLLSAKCLNVFWSMRRAARKIPANVRFSERWRS